MRLILIHTHVTYLTSWKSQEETMEKFHQLTGDNTYDIVWEVNLTHSSFENFCFRNQLLSEFPERSSVRGRREYECEHATVQYRTAV